MVNPSRNFDILLLKLEWIEKKEYSTHQNETDAGANGSLFSIILL
jgi:hypothetical protein